MACLKRLKIQGVRSVGPNEENQVEVKFFTPFTILTGENGAGKTTIIESLKFACSGSLPPGSKTNAGWIHHPKQTDKNRKRNKNGKLIQTGKILSRIFLEFATASVNGEGGKIVAVNRALEGTLKTTGGMSMKTLDGRIVVKDARTKEKMLEKSEKLEDLNTSVRKYLNLPKPILEYVIFCHQEDTLWPFEDSKKLKEKFDDIFQSAEYVKVMAAFKKERKTQHETFKAWDQKNEKF